MPKIRFVFQESKPYQTTVVDEARKPREVSADNEAGARTRLPKPGYGRVWKLVNTFKQADMPCRSVPVSMMGATIGVADVRADGTIDVHIEDGLRLRTAANIYGQVRGVNLGWSLDI